MTAITINRRAMLALFSALGATRPQAATRTPVVVLTAYPEEVTSRFEAAFEKAEPGYRLQLVWRMPHDALPYLQAPGHNGVDVYWSASPRTYAALKLGGALRRMDGIERSGLPTRIGGTEISDTDGHYLATEVAGYGWALNPARLAALGLAQPADWPDLALAAWHGQVVLPAPSRVGFAPPMVDIVLQAFGWERGWALWSAIAGNAALVGAGSTFVTDEVASGRRAAGLTIDFFAAAAVASGAPLAFGYPAHGGINPAHIAITRDAPHPEGAQAFVRFMLSEDGQALLGHPRIRKLPVRPSAYARLPEGSFNIFEAARAGGYDYDNARGQARLGLISALFEQAFVADAAEHAEAWRRLHAADVGGHPRAAEARALLEAAPGAEALAQDTALLARLGRLEGSTQAAPSDAERGWRDGATRRRQQALALLA
ncbi:ABC transporter substrate-binding protein [Roseateles cellulosilyticus]|uniref:Extracellular solute-binding protein n=1 Tax=Pelomonas cellulosilytica TaxID=2906762 RepID=A0ABS8XZ09_9BURK|nr:extracellular solute-binding protein [Pelomonas sp. P8]MCE4556533.1 extracellular solute-binding protein [Pelomonas sp. P8]